MKEHEIIEGNDFFEVAFKLKTYTDWKIVKIYLTENNRVAFVLEREVIKSE